MPSIAQSVRPSAAAVQPSPSRSLRLQGFSYDDRREVLPAVGRALDLCGCWVLERTATSLSRLELRFEAQLGWSVDLYSALVGSGLELTRDSHLCLTGLCTLRNHHKRRSERAGILEITLEITFLEEIETQSLLLAPGAAA